MSNRFRPSSRNVLGAEYADELLQWGANAFREERSRMRRASLSDGRPPLNQRTNEQQQLKLLSEARDKQLPAFMSNPAAQERLAELERKQGPQGF